MGMSEIPIFLLFRPPKIRMCLLQFLTFYFRTCLKDRQRTSYDYFNVVFFCINLARSAEAK